MPRKPQQQRAKVTVETIIESGFICMAKYGIEGATTRQIAETAGISIGSLYEYFKNKEAVYDAMAKHFVDDIEKMLRALIPELVQIRLEDLVVLILTRFSAFLQKDSGRYLKAIIYIGHFDYVRYSPQIENVLMELVMRYMMHNPQYLKLKNISTISYVCVNGGIFAVIRHLSAPNQNISFDELIKGLAKMTISYVNAELADCSE